MATKKWLIDTSHSEIGFKVKHMMFTNVSGKFQNFNASIETDGDDFENATIQFEGDTNSITTRNADRDAHLLSEDFFNAEVFPKITFNSTSFKKINEGYYVLVGDLGLHGVTNPVTLETEISGILKDPWGNAKVGLTLSGKINRKDWNLNWNSALEAGGVLVGEEVKLNIDLQFIKQ